MHNVYLLLGSNLGDREKFLQKAIHELTARVGEVSRTSSVYETQSWGKTDAPHYLNQVVLVQTALSPHEVLNTIQSIEQAAGRERLEQWGSRTLDIDILYYDELIIQEPPYLVIPHPRLHERLFTLIPLVEIAPDYQHPVLAQTNLELKTQVTDELQVKKM
jgi:2-amino-4-hydroxy-6-hydroxymethyldihydropteridine diphosphokinase